MASAYDELAQSALSDADLLARLRAGDQSAYVALWTRHVSAATRLAHRLSRTHAEDLVSDAFLAVYHQVTVAGNGPQSAFRAYLFTTMRNTAIRWAKESGRYDTVAEIDGLAPAEARDGLSLLEDELEAAELLAAFQELPERWQRVLWLSEVENVARPVIARDLDIRPNAVSKLVARAKSGLRLQWLLRQVPVELRDDVGHTARLLPQHLVGGEPITEEAEAHMLACARCADLRAELSAAAARMRRSTLSIAGLAGLGVALPAASPLSSGVQSGAAAVAVGAAAGGGAMASGGVVGAGVGAGVLLASGVLALVLLISPGVSGGADEKRSSSRSAASAQDTGGETGHGHRDRDDEKDENARGAASGRDAGQGETGDSAVEEEPDLRTGRGNGDESIERIEFGEGGSHEGRVPRDRPTPVGDDDVPDPSTDPDSLLAVTVAPGPSHGYLAPVLRGSTAPGARVMVQLEGLPGAGFPASPQTFDTRADASGGWSFDLRLLERDTAGTYAYRVWAADGDEASPLVLGEFTLSAITVRGFEGNPSMPLAEASTTGVVIVLQGPANGTVCLDSWTGQSAVIPLDDQGASIRRVRLLTGGFFVFNFRACSDGYVGVNTEAFAEAVDSTQAFEPWGPDPLFEIGDP